jgi:hypothetical protein
VQKIPVRKQGSLLENDFSGKSKKNGNNRVVHFPNEALEYDEDSDERTNPMTNQTITSGIPKLPVPKMKLAVKKNFENVSKPISDMIEIM